MINKVVVVGRLTKDPELRYTPSGVATVRFTVASNRPFASANGEKEADFIQCVAWRKQAENLANFQRKGALIGVEGRIQTGSYDGQDGKKVYTTDVVADSIAYLEPNSNGGQGQSQNQQQQGQYSGQGQQPQYGAQPQQGQQQYNAQPQQQQQFAQGQPQQQFDPAQQFAGQPQQQFAGQQPQQQFSGQPQQQFNGGQPGFQPDPFANTRGPIEVSEDDLPF